MAVFIELWYLANQGQLEDEEGPWSQQQEVEKGRPEEPNCWLGKEGIMTARGTKQKEIEGSSEWERQEGRFTTGRHTKIRIRERPGREESASVFITLGKEGSAFLLCHGEGS